MGNTRITASYRSPFKEQTTIKLLKHAGGADFQIELWFSDLSQSH